MAGNHRRETAKVSTRISAIQKLGSEKPSTVKPSGHSSALSMLEPRMVMLGP